MSLEQEHVWGLITTEKDQISFLFCREGDRPLICLETDKPPDSFVFDCQNSKREYQVETQGQGDIHPISDLRVATYMRAAARNEKIEVELKYGETSCRGVLEIPPQEDKGFSSLALQA